MYQNIRAIVSRHGPWIEGIELHLRAYEPFSNAPTKVLHIIEWKEISQEEIGKILEPVGYLTIVHAQELMDSLWDSGLRPTEGKGSAGALLATEKHLQDMRQIAFKFVENKDANG